MPPKPTKNHGKNATSEPDGQPENSLPTRESADNRTRDHREDNSKLFHDESGEVCENCHIAKGGAWVVQCDGCDLYYHFNCVMFDPEEVKEEDEWFCVHCRSLLERHNQPIEQNTGNDGSGQTAEQVHGKMVNVQSDFMSGQGEPSQRAQGANDRQNMIETFIQWKTARDQSNAEATKSNEPRFNSTKKVDRPSQQVVPTSTSNKTSHSSQRQQNVLVTTARTQQGPESIAPVGTNHIVETTKRLSSKELPSKSSSTSSKRSGMTRADVEKQRLQEELTLQAKLDEERIALKLEALKLKEEREKRFLKEYYEAMKEAEDDNLSNDGESRISRNSKCHSSSKHENSTGHVLAWIEDQRRQKSQLPHNIPNLSIDISNQEIENIVVENSSSMVARDGRLGRKNDNAVKFLPNGFVRIEDLPEGEPDPRVNSTSMVARNGCLEREKDNAVTFLRKGFVRIEDLSECEPNPKVNSTLIDKRKSTVDQRQGGKNVQTQRQPNENSGRTTGMYQIVNLPINQPIRFNQRPLQQNPLPHQNQHPAVTQQQQYFANQPTALLGQYSTGHQPSQSSQQNAQNSGAPRMPCNQSQQPFPTTNQSANRITNAHQQSAQPPVCNSQVNVNPLAFQFDDKMAADAFQYVSVRTEPLTTNQIAARHVISKRLPNFNGHPRDWPAFYQKFRRTTVACGFDNTENLDRLIECLKGDAETIVKSMLEMPDFVPMIMATLEDKFGRKEIVVKATLEEIRAEPTIRADKLEALSTFGYKVQNVCHTVQTQKMDFYLHDPNIIQDLVDKLPHQIKIDWARHAHEAPQVTLVTLSDWLIKLSRSINRITMPEISVYSNEKKVDKKPEKSKESPKDSWINKRTESKGTYLNAHGDEGSSNQVNGAENLRCEYCSKGCKTLVECSKFKGVSASEKWKFIYRHKKICRCCLQVHRKKCTVAKDCGVNGCTYKHHPLLHENEKMIKSKPQGQLSTQSRQTVQLNGTVKGTSCNAHRGGRTVLYKIIPVQVKNGQKTVLTCAYMDDGSGLTLLENDLAEELGIKGTPQKLSLRWTNGTVRHEDNSMRVMLEITGGGENHHVYKLKDVRTVESLDLPEQKINKELLVKQYPYLERITFTDFEASSDWTTLS